MTKWTVIFISTDCGLIFLNRKSLKIKEKNDQKPVENWEK